jgi:hypothetical protein
MKRFCQNCQCFNVCKYAEKRTPDLCKYYAARNGLSITPDEYREIEGDELDGRAAVYGLYEALSYIYAKPPSVYWKPFSYAGALGNPNVSAIVCAYNLKGPPPADWRPE